MVVFVNQMALVSRGLLAPASSDPPLRPPCFAALSATEPRPRAKQLPIYYSDIRTAEVVTGGQRSNARGRHGSPAFQKPKQPLGGLRKHVRTPKGQRPALGSNSSFFASFFFRKKKEGRTRLLAVSGAHDFHGDGGPLVEAVRLVAHRADVLQDDFERATVLLADLYRGFQVLAHALGVKPAFGQ